MRALSSHFFVFFQILIYRGGAVPPAARFLGKKLGKNLQPNKVEGVAV